MNIQSNNTKEVKLNQGQQAAADGLFGFLFDDQNKCAIISGAGGYGKTYLMSYIFDRLLPEYYKVCQMMAIEPLFTDVSITSTTNKSAEVLAEYTGQVVDTIHSFLNLKVKEDFVAGRGQLIRTDNWTVHKNKILFIDECSMIDAALLQIIHEGTHDCKIVFVGDHCQLGPVGDINSPVYRQGYPMFELTEPVRNAEQPALMALAQQLRNTVETGVFQPIQLVPGVIDKFNDEEMQISLAETFKHQTRDARILAFTNKRVLQYAEYLRMIRGQAHEYTVGELLINNSAIRLTKFQLSVEAEVEIIAQADTTEVITLEEAREPNVDAVKIEVRRTQLKTRKGIMLYDVRVPVDRNHYMALLEWYRQTKNWNRFYWIKNNIPDLRSRDAATVHKSQGSTYNVVYIDAEDLSTCKFPNVVARLLNVACTRPRSRIIFYGDLSEKYGGFIE